MNLIADIGNSSVKAAVFSGQDLVERCRIDSDPQRLLLDLVERFPIAHCGVSIVGADAQEVLPSLRRWAQEHLGEDVLVVDGTTPTPLVIDYRTPYTLGADRLAACVGAASLCPARELLVVDAGTCVTYDRVSAAGHYLGGNISPGVGIRLRMLHSETAALPLVDAQGETPCWGYDTVTALRSGVLRGIALEVEGYIRLFRQQHPEGHVYMTGGNGHRFALDLPDVDHQDDLVERGINEIVRYHTATDPQTHPPLA